MARRPNPINGAKFNITPQQQRYAMIGIGAAALLGVGYMFTSNPEAGVQQRDLRPVTRSLTGTNVVDLTIDDLASQQNDNRDQIDQLRADLNELSVFMRDRLGFITEEMRNAGDLSETALSDFERRRQEEIAALQARNEELTTVIESLNTRIGGFEQELAQARSLQQDLAERTIIGQLDPEVPGAAGREGVTVVDPGRRPSRNDIFTSDDLYGPPPAPGLDARDAARGTGPNERNRARATNQQGPAAVRPVSVRRSEESVADEQRAGMPVLEIATGSIIRATLLSGVDAPTGTGGASNPLPMLLRIDREALMPNRFRSDVRDCFLLVSGNGELSTGRVNARGERISCIMDDGEFIEGPIMGYATAEDGKVGFPGRVVHKAGSALAAAALAGFASGISEAFQIDIVPVIETNPSGGSATTQNRFNGVDSLQSAAASGASSALDRLAGYYLELAEQTLPVIEVNAGRSVEFILTAQVSLSPDAGLSGDAAAVARNTVRRIQ